MDPNENTPKDTITIRVVGPNVLQNKFMVDYLKQHTGVMCSSHSLASWPEMIHETREGTCLFLLDAKNLDLSTSRDFHKMRYGAKEGKCFFALFNSDRHMQIEKEALARGFHGIFYNEDSLDSLASGALSILNGELWFSRKILYECLNDRQFAQHSDSVQAETLTFREKEILLKMLTGASNKKIADELCISPHTVKTHIYNIYKKLNINNRLQAMLWTAKHL